MKLSTTNLSKKLRSLVPKLAGKLSRDAGKTEPRKTETRKTETRKTETRKTSAGQKGLEGKSLESANSPEVSAFDAKFTEANLANRSSINRTHRQGAVPAFIKSSRFVKNSKSVRVAFHLLLVKPWVLVIGLWLFSAFSAVVAIEGLVSPSRLRQTLPEPAAEVTPVARGDRFIDVEQSGEELVGDESADSGAIAAEPTTPADVVASDTRFPVWPLVMLVGGCAAGCVVISRRRAMIRLAATRAKNRGRKLVAATPIRTKASNIKPIRRAVSAVGKNNPVVSIKSAPVKSVKSAIHPIEKSASGLDRAKKRRQRQRPLVQSASTKKTGANRVLVSRSSAQQAAPKSRVSTPDGTPRVRRKVARGVHRQPIVSVVPANQSNRLDWTDGSLAHDMDVRPRRASM